MKILAQIAFRNAFKNWRHSLAAIISISAGFLSLVLFQGYITDVNHLYEDGYTHRAMYGHLLIENPKGQTSEGRSRPEDFLIPVEQQQKINQFLLENEKDVDVTVRFLPVTGMVTNGKNSFIFVAMGYDVDAGAKIRAPNWVWETLYGVPMHISKDPQGVVLGQSLGFLLGCVPDQKIATMAQNGGYAPENRPFHCNPRNSIQLSATTVTGQLNAIDLNVVGLIDGGYKDIDEKWMKISIENAQMLMNTDKIRFQSVLLHKSNQMDAFVNKFNNFAKSEKLDVTAIKWYDHRIADVFKQTKSLLGIFQTFIVTVILTIACLSVLNTVVKSVKERTREIGTLRSIGFTGRQVGFIFSMEALYLSMMGVAVGAFVAIIVTVIVNKAGILYRAGLLSEPIVFKIGFDRDAYLLMTVLLAMLAILASHLAAKSTVSAPVSQNLTHV
jgi:putative ABC transport system permease protein